MRKYVLNIATVIFLCVFSSCHTAHKAYTLRTVYITNTELYMAAEVVEGIKTILSQQGIQSISRYENTEFYIETDWKRIATAKDTGLNMAQRFAGSTENTITYIKYYFKISNTYYSLRAVERCADGTSIYAVMPNNVVDVPPNSELWRHIRLLAQAINKGLHITGYHLTTQRERL